MSGQDIVFNLDWEKSGGLIPAIVQDVGTGRILMLGYMNEAAVATTCRGGRVTFYSRTRRDLWTKGETSGHYLELVSIDADCDGDTLLVRARPQGPTCHTGSDTCFEQSELAMETLGALFKTIQSRAESDPEASYTRKLLHQEVAVCGAKVREEADELVTAALKEGKQRTVEEAADLIYHLWVLLQCQEISLEEVAAELRSRRKEPQSR